MQVFNRGGFSEGHLNEKENKELIYSKKPNNMGLYLGNIVHYNKLKGLITLESHENLSIGDTISVEKEDYTYTVSELMIEIYKYKNKYKNGHGSFACPFFVFV